MRGRDVNVERDIAFKVLTENVSAKLQRNHGPRETLLSTRNLPSPGQNSYCCTGRILWARSRRTTLIVHGWIHNCITAPRTKFNRTKNPAKRLMGLYSTNSMGLTSFRDEDNLKGRKSA